MAARVFKGLHKRIQMRLKEPVKAGFFSQSGQGRVDIDGIFLADFQEVDDFGMKFGAPHPTFWIEQGCVNPIDGDLLEIGDKVYKIREVSPASSQYIKLTLQDEGDDRNF